ncbi:alkaline phosphatase [Planococcus lenghuensis]|uniref:Alkaline phosphatase n=1 Tax=Planococcus lenghuensis TaxID=2213202 RepID=A0A1Q2L517_9BACL|nr:alkaline phosphatase [Planococcus lenghuensis]AQQ55516.1 alkaline phosphatase [Planococcus lenghuensis]
MSTAALSSLALGSISLTPVSVVAAEEEKTDIEQAKNVIMMIGDGMGPAYMTAYRYYTEDPETQVMEDTVFDPYLTGMQKVYSADPFHDGGEGDTKENIPDSAATATAMASGVKTYNGAIGVDLDQQETKTVLEAAKEAGKATGLVATSQINHATPAAYGSHDESRRNYNEIANDYFDNTVNGEHVIDVLLGGGTDYFVREDRDLTEEFQNDDYSYVTSTEELQADNNDQVLGLFAPVGLDKAIDRPEEQPSLAQMTEAALDRLSEDEDGFFLMVEGSQIDWAGHDNDVVAAMSEMEDFAGAFEEVMEFAKENEDTLVVTTADHSTGGLSIGRGSAYEWHPEVIHAAEKTPDYMAALIAEGADIEDVLRDNIGFELTTEEIQSVIDAKDNAPEEELLAEVDNAIEHIFNVRSGTGWTTDGHTGEDVPVYAYGPGSELFNGMIDNTDNAENIFKIMELATDENLNGVSVEGEELADTATNYPLGTLAGIMAILMGGALLATRKRKPLQ